MKAETAASELAIFGAPPAFANAMHVGRPRLPDQARFLDAVKRILERNILTNDGPEVRALEERFRDLTGTGDAVAVCNATIGLQLVAKALGLQGRILVPAFTFVATAHAFKWLGLEPVFCDIDPITHNLDPQQVEVHLQRGVSAVVGVHVWGGLCAPLELERLCRQYGVPLIFDAAHAVGCSQFGRAAGAFGTAEVFSLHATKVCHSFEGGMITTRDPALANRLRQARNFGFAGYDRVDGLGINAKLPEVSAAMGRLSLDGLEEQRAVNRRNLLDYHTSLQTIPGCCVRPPDPTATSNHHYIVAEFGPPLPADTRDVVYAALHAENVLVRRYFYPGCHRMEPYRSEQPDAAASLPQTESLCRRVLCFPNGPDIDGATITRIAGLVHRIVAHLPAIRAELARAATPG